MVKPGFPSCNSLPRRPVKILSKLSAAYRNNSPSASQEASSLKDVSESAITLFLQIHVVIYEHRLSHLNRWEAQGELVSNGVAS